MAKEKNKTGCLFGIIALAIIIAIAVGLGYVMRFFLSYIQAFIPEWCLYIAIITGFILLGISYFATYFGEVDMKEKNGELHLSSPLWLDISRWGGMFLFGLALVISLSSPEPSWLALFLNCLLIATFMTTVVIMVMRVYKDLNDKMIIADDYLSIDMEMSNEKKIIKKNNIIKLESFTVKGHRSSSHYIRIVYKELKDNVESENKFEFEPEDQLNISRDVIIKHLKSKGYIVEKVEEVE
jgi:hypothetical protein